MKSDIYQSLLNIVSNSHITKDIESLLKNDYEIKLGNKPINFQNNLQLQNVSFKYSSNI